MGSTFPPLDTNNTEVNAETHYAIIMSKPAIGLFGSKIQFSAKKGYTLNFREHFDNDIELYSKTLPKSSLFGAKLGYKFDLVDSISQRIPLSTKKTKTRKKVPEMGR